MKKVGFFQLACITPFLFACNEEANTGIEPLDTDAVPAFAVQRGDFSASASVALLAEDGTLLNAEYISSSTNLPGLSAALVGDLFLPSSPCNPDLLTVGGRLGGDYILQVNLEQSEIERQIKTQGVPSGAVFSSNPQDVLCLADGRALVSRLGVNLSASRDDLDRGDDLILVNLDKSKIESRVSLSAYEGKLATADAETTFASPGSIVRAGDSYALVGLSRLSAVAFQPNPEGAVLVVDLAAFTTKKVLLEGLANCGALFAVPGVRNAAIVQCAGAPYGSKENAGLVYVSVEQGEASVGPVFRGELNGVPLIGNPTPIDEMKVIVATADFVGGTPDGAYLVDLATGKFEHLFDASAPGDLGSGAVHPETGLVLLPDVTVGIRVFEYNGRTLAGKTTIALKGSLPARNIRPLREL